MSLYEEFCAPLTGADILQGEVLHPLSLRERGGARGDGEAP
jgi:hypothetical protein